MCMDAQVEVAHCGSAGWEPKFTPQGLHGLAPDSAQLSPSPQSLLHPKASSSPSTKHNKIYSMIHRKGKNGAQRLSRCEFCQSRSWRLSAASHLLRRRKGSSLPSNRAQICTAKRLPHHSLDREMLSRSTETHQGARV